MKTKYQILIVGGGTAGITSSAWLKRINPKLDIGLIEPSDKHYYHPAWTLVGANAYSYEKTIRPTKPLIPKGVDWIQDYAEKMEPKKNSVTTRSGINYEYDYLIVCPGIHIDVTMIEGLQEALERRDVVCSNYIDPKFTWHVMKNFKGGNAVFAQPTTAIKCGGAPQKIAYLTADYLRRNSLADKSNIILTNPGNVIFGVKEIAKTLLEVVERYKIHLRLQTAPVKIDSKNRIITLKTSTQIYNQCVINVDNKLKETPKEEKTSEDKFVELPYEMLHLAPPQRAPDFIRDSELASETGWLAVDKETMQHKKFPNIFGLGDVCDLPTAKTGAAVRKQVPIMVNNLMSVMNNEKELTNKYNGYSSCPLVTGYGKMVLAEFNYQNEFIPDPKLKQLLVFNSSKEHYQLWVLKKYILPYLYWNKLLKGIPV